MNSNNATIYGIESKTERLLWACYCMFVLLSSLIGNTVILVASMKHHALRLNPFLVTLMEQIAVCDLIASTVYVLPMATSLIADEWVLGDMLAYIFVYLQYIAYPAGILFVAGLIVKCLYCVS